MRSVCILLTSLLMATAASGDVLPPCGSAQAVVGVAGPHANPRTVYLTDYVTVWVCHADAFLAEAEARQEKVTLYVKGVDTHNEPVAINDGSGAITFVLDRTDENKSLWNLLLYNPLF